MKLGDFELPELNFFAPETEAISLSDDEFAAVLSGGGSIEPELQSPPALAFTSPLSSPLSLSSPPLSYQSPPVAPLTEADLELYLFAAACRYTFRLDYLTPLSLPASPPVSLPRYSELPRAHREQVFQYLTTRSQVVTDAQGQARWMIADAERRAALTEMIRRGLASSAVASARHDALLEQQADATEAPLERLAVHRRYRRRTTNLESPLSSPLYSPLSSPLTSPLTSPLSSPLSSPLTSPLSSPPADTTDDIEETLWRAISGISTPLAEQSRRQLLLTQRVSNWLYGINTAVPPPNDVAQALARETLLQPFRHLCGHWHNGKFVTTFRGRDEERNRIDDYLNLLPPGSRWDAVKRSASRLVDSAWSMVSSSTGSKPLFIHGLGGTGKSTLLAKILLDHLTAPQAQHRFPYAYLDFDLSALNAKEPLTLLAEAARQLALEFPSSADAWNSVREQWLDWVRRSETVDAQTNTEALHNFASLLRDSKTGAGEARGSDEIASLSLSNVRELRVEDIFARGLPFLLVLDTFEEVQYADRFLVKDVVRFLNELRREIPSLKAIIMGRAPLDDLKSAFVELEAHEIEADKYGTGIATDFGVVEVALGDLDPNDAIEYLTSQGIQDRDFARELVDVIGGSPLSLRIIARLFNEEPLDIQALRKEMEPASSNWISDLFSRKKATPKAVIQAVLFNRFLGHIHDKEIKKLAHPGLVLRRITPEIIQKVLAGPCGLGVLSPEKAQEYFSNLEREVSLVGTDNAANGTVLVHRPDLRRVMLRLMQADQSDKTMPERIRLIHQGAVDYYAGLPQPGLPERTEELYHRLMLGLPDPRPVPVDEIATQEAINAGHATAPPPPEDSREVWNALVKDVDELPPSGVGYLAARLQRELLTDAEWGLAHRADLELMILGRCTRQIRSRGTTLTALLSLEQGISTLSVAPAILDPISPLHVVRIALNVRLGQFDRVQELSAQHLDLLSKYQPELPTCLRRQGEAHLLAAEADFRAGRAAGSVEHLKAARSTTARLLASADSHAAGQRLARQTLRFAVKMTRPVATADSVGFLVTSLGQLLDAHVDSGVLQRPVLVRELANLFSRQDTGPHVIESLLPLLDKLPGWISLLSPVIPGMAGLQLVLKMGESVYEILHKDREASPHSLWSRLIAAGLPQKVQQSLTVAGMYPIGEDDVQAEARRFGDLIPGEATTLFASVEAAAT